MPQPQTNLGFGGQWVDLMPTGTHTDSAGRRHTITAEFLEAVVRGYDAELHEAPAVVGHPADDAPAYGWVCALRVHNGRLQAQFADVDEAFEDLNRRGRFKKRSASFYTDAGTAPGGRAPYLRHVGFLGAQPPAIKGLRPIHFNEGETLTLNVSFSEGAANMDEKDRKELTESVTTSAVQAVTDYFKRLFGGGERASEATSFSEADVRRIAEDAVKTATATIGAQLATANDTIKQLRTDFDQQKGVTTRTEIVAFCERFGHGKIPPAFKKAGVVEFMETLAALPAEQKVTIVSFSEDDTGNKTTTSTEQTPLAWFQNFLQLQQPFVSFGEQFGDLAATGDGSEIVNPARLNELRAQAGLKVEGGAK